MLVLNVNEGESTFFTQEDIFKNQPHTLVF